MIRPTDDTLQEFERRFKEAERMNLLFVDELIRAVKLCAPLSNALNVLYSYNSNGIDLNRRIYNELPKMCNSLRAAKLHSLLLPTNKHWAAIHDVDSEGVEKYDADLTDLVFNYINDSNLHTQTRSLFLDFNIGSAALWCDSPSDEEPLRWKALPGIALMPEFSENPTSVNLWYKKAIGKEEIREEWSKNSEGYNFLSCGYLKIKEEYVYVSFLNDDFSKPYEWQVKPYNQLVLVHDVKRAGETRGRGVILQCLEAIEFINTITGGLKKYLEYAVDPALVGWSDLPRNLRGLKGALIPSDLIRGTNEIKPLTWDYDIGGTYKILNERENLIREYFNVTPFGQVQNTPVRTATEVGIRQSELERQDASDISGAAFYLINGIIKCVLGIIKNRALRGHDRIHDNIKIVFDTPEIDIQNTEDLNAIVQYEGILTQMLGQGSFAFFNRSQVVDSKLKSLLKIPSDFSKSPEQIRNSINRIQQAQQQQSQQQQQAQQQQQQRPLQSEATQPQQAVNPQQLGSPLGGIGA